MTVRELIAWLATQDQEATVQVVEHTSGKGWDDQGGNATVVAFEVERSEYTDLRGNQHVAPEDPHFNQRFLLLGVHNG